MGDMGQLHGYATAGLGARYGMRKVPDENPVQYALTGKHRYVMKHNTMESVQKRHTRGMAWKELEDDWAVTLKTCCQ